MDSPWKGREEGDSPRKRAQKPGHPAAGSQPCPHTHQHPPVPFPHHPASLPLASGSGCAGAHTPLLRKCAPHLGRDKSGTDSHSEELGLSGMGGACAWLCPSGAQRACVGGRMCQPAGPGRQRGAGWEWVVKEPAREPSAPRPLGTRLAGMWLTGGVRLSPGTSENRRCHLPRSDSVVGNKLAGTP